MRPNIVVVFLDDHAQWANGCYGNREVRTPTLDYLAKTGVVMDNAFTPTPVCSPARACFFTGRIASQHGVHDYLNTWDPDIDSRAWLAHEVTITERLRDVGYTTALAGKWHLGQSYTRQHGFDYWYEERDTVGEPCVDGPWPDRLTCGPNYDNHAITDRAVDFLRARDASRPFFLFAGYFATHSPWAGHPERLVESYRDATFSDIPSDTVYRLGRLASESLMPTRDNPREALAQYYASVSEVDEQVGRLIDELDAQGIIDDTLVIYTSDHGLNMGHHGLWGKGNASKPYNMLEESIRVPLILNQGRRIVGGQRRSEMVTHCDLFSTILDHAGLSPAEGEEGRAPYPGRSFAKLLKGGAEPAWPEEVYGEYGPLRMIRTADHKLVLRYPEGPNELFDLNADPRETRNLIADASYADLVALLSERLDTYFRRFAEEARSGLAVNDLSSYNREEVWRYPDADNLWWERQ